MEPLYANWRHLVPNRSHIPRWQYGPQLGSLVWEKASGGKEAPKGGRPCRLAQFRGQDKRTRQHHPRRLLVPQRPAISLILSTNVTVIIWTSGWAAINKLVARSKSQHPPLHRAVSGRLMCSKWTMMHYSKTFIERKGTDAHSSWLATQQLLK